MGRFDWNHRQPQGFGMRSKESAHDFVHFTCTCGERQTLVVRIGKRTCACITCGAYHRILPTERTSLKEKER